MVHNPGGDDCILGVTGSSKVYSSGLNLDFFLVTEERFWCVFRPILPRKKNNKTALSLPSTLKKGNTKRGLQTRKV